jgi:hypothetical protein
MHEQEERGGIPSTAVRAILGFLLSAIVAYGVAWHLR